MASFTHTTELLTQNLLAKILASTYDPTTNIVMVISITIIKTLNIHDSVKKIIYAASPYDPTANIVIVINITIIKTLNIYDSVKKIIYAASIYDIATVRNINKTFGIHATMFLTERI